MVPHVPIQTHVAERLFGEEVSVAVAVHIYEPVPLPDVKVRELSWSPVVSASRGRLLRLEKEELVVCILYEKVLISVRIDVDELRTRNVEPTEEGSLVRETVEIDDLERGRMTHPTNRTGI